MSLKNNYTRLLFFFIIFFGINLLIIKIKSSDYIYENILGVLKNHRSTVMKNNELKNERIISVLEMKESTNITALTKKLGKFSVTLKDNESTLKKILETCKENNFTTSPIKRNFLYSFEHNGLYCWIRKVGSTSFTKMFFDMNDRVVTRNYFREMNILNPKSERLLNNLIKNPKIFKLLVVRHPFERLVSAYRDRIEDNSRYTDQAWIYASKIFHVTRPELFESFGTIDESLLKIFQKDKRLKLIPSFKEFIRWLLQQDSAKDDPHWNQYHRQCALCSVQYNFVLKLDNYTKTDIDYIFTRMNLNKNKIYLSKLEQTKAGKTNFEETCNYFKNLTHEMVVNLYEKYRIDFDMFNYEFDKYFECTDGD